MESSIGCVTADGIVDEKGNLAGGGISYGLGFGMEALHIVKSKTHI